MAKRLIILIAGFLLSACSLQAPQPTPVLQSSVTHLIADFCKIAEPIRFSKLDTPMTIKQIKRYNVIGEALKCW
jgi:hypothetical protein